MTKESEKVLERKLTKEVERIGGWSIKLLSDFVKGLPDRLCMFSGGRIAFVEVKTTGRKVTKLQNIIHNKLRSLGFSVYVIDSSEGIKEFIEIFQNGE